MLNRFQVFWYNLWHPVKIRWGEPRESLRDRFNRVRTTAYTYRDEELCFDTGSVSPEEVPSGSYNLRFNLADLCESNSFPDRHIIKNAVEKKPNADDIVNVVLKEISKMNKFSQDIKIEFKMKSGWKGYIKLWLYPKIYYGKPSGSNTDSSEIYLVGNDPSFLNWESISYCDSNGEDYQPSYNIYLNTKDYWDRYTSHYSGIWSVSWVEYYNKWNQRTK